MKFKVFDGDKWISKSSSAFGVQNQIPIKVYSWIFVIIITLISQEWNIFCKYLFKFL